MNCFNHKDVVSVGQCKSCCRGLCIDCISDLGHGIACKNTHEAEVENLNMVINRSTQVYKEAPKNIIVTSIFYSFMGASFMYLGYIGKHKSSSTFLLLGLGFIVYGIVIYFKNKKSFQSSPNA